MGVNETSLAKTFAKAFSAIVKVASTGWNCINECISFKAFITASDLLGICLNTNAFVDSALRNAISDDFIVVDKMIGNADSNDLGKAMGVIEFKIVFHVSQRAS